MSKFPARNRLLISLIAAFIPASVMGGIMTDDKDPQARAWVAEMKQQRLGPFTAVRWFCADGSILEPKAFACKERGGGRQHGLRGERAELLRKQGLLLGNVLAEIEAAAALADDARLLKSLLVEEQLKRLDDGWIYRKARYVRGVFQGEVDELAAEKLLKSMLESDRFLRQDFLLLRETARLLQGNRSASVVDAIRLGAARLAQADENFATLRNKIHSRLEPSDAEQVRQYAAKLKDGARRPTYEQLASDIDAAYEIRALDVSLDRMATATGNKRFSELARQWQNAASAEQRLRAAADQMVTLRDLLPGTRAGLRPAAIRLSIEAEQAAFIAAGQRTNEVQKLSAAERLGLLAVTNDALFGSGLLTAREREQSAAAIQSLLSKSVLNLGAYREILAQLARPPVWATNRLNHYFSETLHTFMRAEPATELILPDRLRASLALAYGVTHESLAIQSDQLAGVKHELFGKTASSGLRALNPGLARGKLLKVEALAEHSGPPPIVLAPESTADLPAVAGILTLAEGNALSHVQLLARNLGVPNVVVGNQWLPLLREQVGKSVVLAASPGGAVRLGEDGPVWSDAFPGVEQPAVRIEVDRERLDLAQRLPRPMMELRAEDSGRSVGPKAAKLGELASRYPGQVSPGVAVPFGAFRAVLEQKMDADGPHMIDWIREQYRRLAALPEGSERDRATQQFLETVRGRILAYRFDPTFREALVRQLETVFGPDGSYGVFVRSDTNVEDLSGFTGAGLNLTVPNVVGSDAILKAILEVWASPFSVRAYGWRQALMDHPEELYVAALLHKTVPAEKSGVMITADLSSNDPGWVTVATNLGVGGGVEGQAAESLRIKLDGSRVELLASSTEPRRRQVLKEGGSRLVPATAPEFLLDDNDIAALLEVARTLPDRYPKIVDSEGRAAPADVEFAIAGGKLFLNQIRPFLQSDRARSNAFLLLLDAGLAQTRDRTIDLRETQAP